MTSHTPAFYGRRKGRPLGKEKAVLMADLLPQVVLNPKDFDFSQPNLCLEIGFGSGEHLAFQAERHPEMYFLGVEVFENGIANLLQKIQKNNLQNVLIFPDTIQKLLPKIPVQSLEKIFILFPDPWPKSQQRKRRLVNAETFKTFASCLKSGGEFYFASDFADYVETVRLLIQERPLFETVTLFSERPADWPLTAYNRKAEEKGIKSQYLIGKRGTHKTISKNC